MKKRRGKGTSASAASKERQCRVAIGMRLGLRQRRRGRRKDELRVHVEHKREMMRCYDLRIQKQMRIRAIPIGA